MNMKQRAQQGFTLIELMIVVAIIGILAAVAIPQYKDYTAKAKASSVISSLDPMKTAIAICAQELNTLTGCNNGSNGIPGFNKTKEVESATATDGVITVTLAAGVGDPAATKTITVTPDFSTNSTASNIRWTFDATNVTNDAVKLYLQKGNVSSGSAATS